jgi:hypothetical protein
MKASGLLSPHQPLHSRKDVCISGGKHNLDVDELRDGLQPLIAAREITVADLEYARDELTDLKERIEDWQEYRDSISDTVQGIIRHATPELEGADIEEI